jgi:hypothetical protein
MYWPSIPDLRYCVVSNAFLLFEGPDKSKIQSYLRTEFMYKLCMENHLLDNYMYLRWITLYHILQFYHFVVNHKIASQWTH